MVGIMASMPFLVSSFGAAFSDQVALSDRSAPIALASCLLNASVSALNVARLAFSLSSFLAITTSGVAAPFSCALRAGIFDAPIWASRVAVSKNDHSLVTWA